MKLKLKIIVADTNTIATIFNFIATLGLKNEDIKLSGSGKIDLIEPTPQEEFKESKPKKQKAVKQEVVKEEAKEELKPITLDDIRAIVGEKTQAGFREGIKSILGSYGVTKLPDLGEDSYNEVYNRVVDLA